VPHRASLIEIPDKSALLLVGNFARRQTTDEQPADDDDTCLEDVKIKAEMSAICFCLRFAREMDEGPVKGFAKILDNLHGKKFHQGLYAEETVVNRTVTYNLRKQMLV